MNHVTLAMAARIDQDEVVVLLQGVDIPMSRPTLRIPGKPVLENQGRSFPLEPVVDPMPWFIAYGIGLDSERRRGCPCFEATGTFRSAVLVRI
jgi:hypothetical protein